MLSKLITPVITGIGITIKELAGRCVVTTGFVAVPTGSRIIEFCLLYKFNYICHDWRVRRVYGNLGSATDHPYTYTYECEH